MLQERWDTSWMNIFGNFIDNFILAMTVFQNGKLFKRPGSQNCLSLSGGRDKIQRSKFKRQNVAWEVGAHIALDVNTLSSSFPVLNSCRLQPTHKLGKRYWIKFCLSNLACSPGFHAVAPLLFFYLMEGKLIVEEGQAKPIKVACHLPFLWWNSAMFHLCTQKHVLWGLGGKGYKYNLKLLKVVILFIVLIVLMYKFPYPKWSSVLKQNSG